MALYSTKIFNLLVVHRLPEVDAEPLAIEIEPRRSPNGYILPDPLPKGLVIQDLRQQKWIIGTSVGIGGFGEIYSAASLNSSDSSSYVIKVVNLFICVLAVLAFFTKNQMLL